MWIWFLRLLDLVMDKERLLLFEVRMGRMSIEI